MQITDPIADLLTRIRNANSAKHETVEIPASNTKKAICQILLDEGYIKDMKVEDNNHQGTIVITLKYGEKKPALKVDYAKCVGCKACMKIGCPCISIVSDENGKAKAKIDATLCTGCDLCKQMCKFGAIG